MTEYRCINCGDPDAEPYDLLVRNTSHDGVPLCEACHESIRQELSGRDRATRDL